MAPLLAACVVFASSRTAAARSPTEDDQLFARGQELFDAYAPPEIKQQFAFPTRAEWDAFAAKLEKTRRTGSFAELAAYEPEAKAALAILRTQPEYKDYADWLSERIDEIEIAKEAVAESGATGPVPPTPVPAPTPTPPQPAPGPRPAPPPPLAGPIVPDAPEIPLYDLWVNRMRSSPRPARADKFLPELQKVFTAEGVPAELAWLAETESMFNPVARSPVGASGLFQLMPATARGLGLSLFPFDTRNDPEKSAHAAAKLLHSLHGRFGSWPLALAAYNAGEGRVGRMLKKQDAKTFAEIAASLPTETRLYVPRVLATLAVRTGVAPNALAAPVKPTAVD